MNALTNFKVKTIFYMIIHTGLTFVIVYLSSRVQFLVSHKTEIEWTLPSSFMGYGAKQRTHNRRVSNGWGALKEMFNVLSYQRNAC